MKVLQVHNKYRKHGGEETVLEEEKKVLEMNGHSVIQFIKDSSDLDTYSKADLVALSFSQRKSGKIKKEFNELLQKEKPDVCHVHNVFPLISPVIYEVCKEVHIPVILSVHNYKLICTNGFLFRNGEPCEECISKGLYHSIKYKCYRNSALATALQADTIQYHKGIGTWRNHVDKYLCLTLFQKNKLVSGGVPSEKIVIKPNFVFRQSRESVLGDYFLYVGRLEVEKGLNDLLALFEKNDKAQFVLVGECDTPEVFHKYDNVSYLGKKNREEVGKILNRSRAVIFPSLLFEGMPMVIIEAFASGKPVISRDNGAMTEMIQDGITGLKYSSNSELIRAVEEMQDDHEWVKRMGKIAYEEYERKYSDIVGYGNLMKVYSEVVESKNGI